MMKPRARVGLVMMGVLVLGACEYGLGIDPAPVDPASSFTITNAEGTPCLPDSPVGAAVAEEETVSGPPTDVYEADAEGIFTIDLEAPELPGHYLVGADCATPDLEGPNPDGTYFDTVLVGQDFGVTVDKPQVELQSGSAVVNATFTPCKAENDFVLDEMPGIEAEPETPIELVELRNDFPDLDVFVDGVKVTTIAGTERYPSAPIVVPITLTTVGDHVVEGICTYQTVRWNTELLQAIAEGSGPDLAAAAAVEYPYPEDPSTSPFIWDEDTLEAEAPVRVLAASVGAGTATPPATPAAQPAPAVQAAPRYTG